MIDQIANMSLWQMVLLSCGIVLTLCVAYAVCRIDREDDKSYSPSPEIIKVKYLADIKPLAKTITGDWIDLRAAEDITLYAGQYEAIPLGVAIKLPRGYEALIAPRSSTFKHHGILMANSIGIVDETYCGDHDEWHFLAFATKDTTIKKNERICQFRILEHQPWADMEKVAALDMPDRGGIGSSGRM